MVQYKRPEELPVLVEEQTIREAVLRLGQEISRDYAGKTPLLIGVLKGCFVFMADLTRALTVPSEVDFIRLSSYGAGTTSSGVIHVLSDMQSPISGREIIIVEDVVDSGTTLSFLSEHLADHSPNSIKVCTMFLKGSKANFPFDLTYVGVEIGAEFVVGYGLDYDEQYRYLPDLRVFREKS